MKKIALFNNKGGVAKTTSVINIAYGLYKHNMNVLVVDCDTQENCFTFFMLNTNDNKVAALPTAYDSIQHTTWSGYQAMTDTSSYDYILFDLPPSITEEVQLILRNCDSVYVPTILGEFEIAGLNKVTEEINKQRVKLGGVFVTMYQQDNDAELIEEFRSILQDRLLKAVIPYSKTVRESQKAGLPIEPYFIERGVPHTQSAWKIVNAYNELTDEIMRGGV